MLFNGRTNCKVTKKVLLARSSHYKMERIMPMARPVYCHKTIDFVSRCPLLCYVTTIVRRYIRLALYFIQS